MDINTTLENLRVNYRKASLDVSDCDKDPFVQFNKWFQEVHDCQCDEPNAFVLSTVWNQQPRGRVVLLKGVHEGQFIFYTNYKSRKGEELASNSRAAMTFLWLPLQRQIRIEGVVTKAPVELSEDYFQKRPRGNQLGAVASPQSLRISSRAQLEKLFSDAEIKYQTGPIERPEHWGGYCLAPTYFEFWQGRESRMHDRIVYEEMNGKWSLGRLAP